MRQHLKACQLSLSLFNPIASGPVNTHYGPTGDSCIDYTMIPSHLTDAVFACRVHVYEALNTSDHIPISVLINLGNIPRGAVEGCPQNKLRWDKMSTESMYQRYRAHLYLSLNDLYDRARNAVKNDKGLDNLLQGVIDNVKRCERAIPKSRFRKHIKAYWCPELNDLKQLKIQAYRAWVEAGR